MSVYYPIYVSVTYQRSVKASFKDINICEQHYGDMELFRLCMLCMDSSSIFNPLHQFPLYVVDSSKLQ